MESIQTQTVDPYYYDDYYIEDQNTIVLCEAMDLAKAG